MLIVLFGRGGIVGLHREARAPWLNRLLRVENLVKRFGGLAATDDCRSMSRRANCTR